MISRADILSTAKTALESASALSGISVVLDEGTETKTIEEELRTTGAIISLPPIEKFSPRSDQQAAGALLGDAQFVVRLEINPTINSERTTPFSFEVIRAGIATALVAIAVDAHGDRFRLMADELTMFDSGLMAAALTFQKGAHINPY